VTSAVVAVLATVVKVMDGFHDNLADLGHLDNEHSKRDTPLTKTASSKPLLLPQMNTNVLYSNTTTGITDKRKPSLNCSSSDKEERLTRSNPVTIQAYTEPMPKASCPQCRMKLGAVDAAALGTFKKQVHGRRGRENKKSLLYFGCDFSGLYNCGKIIKTVVTICRYFKAKMHQIRFQLELCPGPR